MRGVDHLIVRDDDADVMHSGRGAEEGQSTGCSGVPAGKRGPAAYCYCAVRGNPMQAAWTSPERSRLPALPEAEAAALHRAVAAYRGDLVDGVEYLWAERAREDLPRRALDAVVRLAGLHYRRPQQAIADLDRAIAFDPYVEEIYR